MSNRGRASLAAWLLVFWAGPGQQARAAGLFFSEGGTRPLGRGGALTAGADDLYSAIENPAGLAFAKDQMLADFGYLHETTTFQRRSLVSDPNAPGGTRVLGEDYFPSVQGTTPFLPLPTLGVSNDLGMKDFNFELSLRAPYSALSTYPEQVPFNGTLVPGPQRYSLLTLEGSALAYLAGTVAYRLGDRLAFGAGIDVLSGVFASREAFSACPPDRLMCASEQPDYDAVAQTVVGPIVSPSASFGAIAVPIAARSFELRLGASAQLPHWIDSPATVQIRLPSSPVFQAASVEGDQARVSMRFPAVLRAGIEARFGEGRATRIEVAARAETWSMHDQITAVPTGAGIQLHGVAGFPDPYPVHALIKPRNFKNSYSIQAGAEHRIDLGSADLTLRAGVSYEKSAVPLPYLSVLTVDLDKVLPAVGASLRFGPEKRLSIDAVFADAISAPVDVDPATAQLTKLKVVQGNDLPPSAIVAINGGHYALSAQVFGLSASWRY